MADGDRRHYDCLSENDAQGQRNSRSLDGSVVNAPPSHSSHVSSPADDLGAACGRFLCANAEEVRRVLRYELDVEILQKWKEVLAIEEELERGEQLLLLIEKLVVNEWVYGSEATLNAATPKMQRTDTTVILKRPMSVPNISYQSQPEKLPATRFVKDCPVIVGNIAKRIFTDGPAVGGPTHRWKLFVRPPDHATASPWIKAVRFILHPSYAPENILTLTRPPFEISCLGWGNFPARIQLAVHSPFRPDQIVELVHQVRVADISSTRYILASEKLYHVPVDNPLSVHLPALTEGDARFVKDETSLDVSHVFNLLLSMADKLRKRIAILGDPVGKRESAVQNSDDGSFSVDGQSHNCISWNDTTNKKFSLAPSDNFHADEALINNQILSMVVVDFPLYGQKGKRATQTASLCPSYNPAQSLYEWQHLSDRERECIESARASAMVAHVQVAFPQSKFTWDAHAVAIWCKARGFVPAAAPFCTHTLSSGSSVILYCRFCGIPHAPQSRFDSVQKACAFRPRKVHVSSRTSAQPLLAAAESRIAHERYAYVSKRPKTESCRLPPLLRPPTPLDAWVADVLAPVLQSIPTMGGAAIPAISAALCVFVSQMMHQCVSELSRSVESAGPRDKQAFFGTAKSGFEPSRILPANEMGKAKLDSIKVLHALESRMSETAGLLNSTASKVPALHPESANALQEAILDGERLEKLVDSPAHIQPGARWTLLDSSTPADTQQSGTSSKAATEAHTLSDQNSPRIFLTPLHIFRALLSRPEFDFATNTHMHGGRPHSTTPGEEGSPPT